MSESPEELESRIAAYIDGELSPAEAARLEVFLANTDPKLAQQVISMIADKHALSSLPKSKAPSDLAARIMEQVERGTLLNDVDQFVAPRRPWWQSKAAVAALLLLIFGGFTWFILQAIHTSPTQWQSIVDNSSPHALNKPAATLKGDTQIAAATPAAPETFSEIAPPPEASRAAPPADSALTVDKDRAASSSIASAKRADEPAPFGAAAVPAPPAATPASPPSVAAAPAATLDRFAQSPESPAPVLLTLAAESPDDFTRLHDAIASLSPSSVPADQLNTRDNTSTDTPRSFSGRGGAGGGGGGFAGGGGRKSPIGGMPAGNANETTTDNSLGTTSANSTFKLSQNEQSAAPQMNIQPSDDLKDQQHQSSPPTSLNTGSVTYHLSLTSSQLTQLTQQFHVKTLSDSPTSKGASTDSLLEKSPSAAGEPATVPATRDEAKTANTLIDCTITMIPSSPLSTQPNK